MRKSVIRAVTLATACLASPLWAGFSQNTTCTGFMKAQDSDGETVYEMTLLFREDWFGISAKNVVTGEKAEDVGRCTSYFDSGCIVPIIEIIDYVDEYRFRLIRQSGDTYKYEEVWADGYTSSAMVTCAPG